MVESDHSDGGELDNGTSTSKGPGENTESVGKRSRGYASEDESFEAPHKKAKTSLEDETLTTKTESISEVNGDTPNTVEQAAKNKIEDRADTDDTPILTSQTELQNSATKKESEEDEKSLHNNGVVTTDSDVNMIVSAGNTDATELHTPKDDKSDKEDADKENESEDDSKGSLVVDGLELKVECASDKEPSSSESDKEDNAKPRPKTIIVKAEPNESELDVGSSEAEKSDAKEAENSAGVKGKEDKKRKKQKDVKRSSGKMKTSDTGGSHDSNSDDEDYSPVSKKKMKKSPVGRKSSKSSPTRRGRGRGRGGHRGTDRKSAGNDHAADNDSSDDETSLADRSNKMSPEKTEKATAGKSSGAESAESSSHNDSDDENKSMTGTKRKRRESVKPEDDKRIQVLKKYIKAAGINVRSYNDIWSGCKSNAARVRRLKELLEERGVKGRPTLEKCRKVKERNERLSEVAALDTKNIISEGRVTRARRNVDGKDAVLPTTPTRHREARNTYKRIQSVVDSDASSE